MAIVRGVRKLLKSDFSEAPGWFDKMLTPFNQFIDSVIGALRNKLTFRDNFYCEVREFEFTHGAELEISHSLIEFNGVLIIQSSQELPATTYAVESFHCREISNTEIGLTIFFKGAGSTKGNIKFVILG